MVFDLTLDEALSIMRCIDKCLPAEFDGSDPGVALIHKITAQLATQTGEHDGDCDAPIAVFDLRVN